MKFSQIYFFLGVCAIIYGITPAYADNSVTLTEKCIRASIPYKKAWAAYDKKARVYWALIEKKKKIRRQKRRNKQIISAKDYISKHPPRYKGPKKPACLKKRIGPIARKKIGIVRDFLRAAKSIYNFVPKTVPEKQYKYIYAKEALAAGLTSEQVVGVFALETGGLGPYNRQSGIFNVTQKCKRIKPRGRPASTALGYAQLLAANTAAVLHENSDYLAKSLEYKAAHAKGKRKKELLQKAGMLRRMARDIKVGIRKYKRRNNWREFVAFAKTKKGFAIHTLNLDVDIGPKIQVRKLKKITDVAKKRGHKKISAAQLEMMNLVGFGRGLEMMTPAARNAPTSNFFTRGGYSRNPVARNMTAKGLLGKLAKIINIKRKKCGSVEFIQAFKRAGKK